MLGSPHRHLPDSLAPRVLGVTEGLRQVWGVQVTCLTFGGWVSEPGARGTKQQIYLEGGRPLSSSHLHGPCFAGKHHKVNILGI